MDIGAIIAVSSVAAIAAAGFLAHRAVSKAPYGHQDADGFHYRDMEPLLPDLSGVEKLVLDCMVEEASYSAQCIANFTGLTKAAVTRARQDLFAAGLVDFGPLYSDGGDGNILRGTGYSLNSYGADVQKRLRAANDNRGTKARAA